MDIALTTRWNNSRHVDGRAMVDEILEMGFNHLELGYDTRIDLVEGIRARIDEGAVKVNSVHNFCPVPIGAHRGHPEIWTMAHMDPNVRRNAVLHTTKTIEFAAEIGAKVIVSHSGYVKTRRGTEDLIALIHKNKQFAPAYDKVKMKFQVEREKKAEKHLNWLYQGVEQLLPVLERTGTYLGLENLPTWEAIPNESEMLNMIEHFNHPNLKYWHDIGHGQIRENLGFINAERWVERMEPHLAGMHLHDVARPIYDHVMPPLGDMDFSRFKRFAQLDIVRVIEPTPRTPAEEIVTALQFFKEQWNKPDTTEEATT